MRTNEHAFGVDDDPLYRIPVPSPVLGVGHISRALLGHSCLAPKPSNFIRAGKLTPARSMVVA